jgi:putative hydrolases of HD superfamily
LVHINEDELSALAGLFSLAGRLKTLKRQGWIDRGVDQPESVADHSFRLALMTLAAGYQRPDIDTNRAVWLALVHDLPEAIVGDRTPFDDRLNEEGADSSKLFHQAPEYSVDADRAKTEAERQAMLELTESLPSELRETLIETWEEYEAGETAEARFVRQLDKLETLLQAFEYREHQPDLIIESFRLGAERDIEDDQLRELMSLLDYRTDPSA